MLEKCSMISMKRFLVSERRYFKLCWRMARQRSISFPFKKPGNMRNLKHSILSGTHCWVMTLMLWKHYCPYWENAWPKDVNYTQAQTLGLRNRLSLLSIVIY